jgi:photosynthetic reaction center H subunit
MHTPEFAGTIDLTLLLFLTFVGFFAGLILYLRREDRREGYPLEHDVTGALEPASGFFFTARPKTFILPFERGVYQAPNGARDTSDLALKRTGAAPGSPFEPVGDPMLAGVGPGAYAQRARRPDIMGDGTPRILPLRLAHEYSIDVKDVTPIGRTGQSGGVVTDVWVDRMEFLIRYLEVETIGPRRVLVPGPMAEIPRGGGPVKVKAVLGSQFAAAPSLESPDQITLFEEERVTAYFGAGYLYATPARAEPIL